jgi:hypothetical protein
LRPSLGAVFSILSVLYTLELLALLSVVGFRVVRPCFP